MQLIDRMRLKVCLLIALCCLSIGFFNGYPRYQVVGPELLANPQLDDATVWTGKRQQVRTEAGGIKLFAADGSDKISIGQRIKTEFRNSLLLLRCEMKSENVVNGERDWYTARVVLFSKDSSGQILNHPHLLASRDGSHDWRHFERAFAIDGQIAEIEVAAQLLHSSGEFWVRNFSLQPVVLKADFLRYRQWLLVPWLVSIGWLALPLLRSSLASRRHAWLLLLIGGILVGVSMPHDLSNWVGDSISAVDQLDRDELATRVALDGQYFNATLELPKLDAFKAGHFLLFALLAMTLASGKPYRLSLVAMLGYLLLLATSSEVLQLFIPGRTSRLGDIAIDMTGALVGLMSSWMVRRRHGSSTTGSGR